MLEVVCAGKFSHLNPWCKFSEHQPTLKFSSSLAPLPSRPAPNLTLTHSSSREKGSKGFLAPKTNGCIIIELVRCFSSASLQLHSHHLAK